jgi:hypothetical protein
MDVWDYFWQKEREFSDLSLTPDREFDDLFAEERGSNGQRGRIFGNLNLDSPVEAFLAVSKLVVVEENHVHREEYAYYLVVRGDEIWGYERDPTHTPAVHRHTEGHQERFEAEPISFKEVTEMAWKYVSDVALTEDD